MKKSKDYTPWLFAFFFTTFPVITHNLLFKPGMMPSWIIMFFVILGLWYLIEWLLKFYEYKLVRWGSVLLGCILYIVFFTGLDFYVLHQVMSFTGFQPLDFGFRMFITAIFATILIERVRWSAAQEKAKIDNLTLQAENIEAKFKLLREQINPEFLFYALTTLRTMVRSNDPQTEDYILKLAEVYRQTLKKGKNVVTLREELDLLRTYMFLMRYGREASIAFEVEVSDASLDYQLPIFALQLLGDNCIKHNVFSKQQPLYIRLFQEDPKSITMTNNYQRKAIPESFGPDMEHLEMRYALEGIENAVLIAQSDSTYSTTLKLF
jgi:sensor histidine kinase YesM